MTEQDLINMGFKKKVLDNEHWYELRIKNHVFTTNDTMYNDRKDKWIVGYENKMFKNGDIFWFNEGLTEESVFKIMFRVLTGYEFKLAHQRKLIK